MPDRLPVAGLYSNGGVARRIIKAEWHVIGWCSLLNPLSSLCSEQATHMVCRAATHHSASHSLRNPVGVSALLWELERASAHTSLSVRRERQLRRVVLVLSCRVLLKRNITDTLPHSQPLPIPYPSLRVFPPLHQASELLLAACSPRRPITG